MSFDLWENSPNLPLAAFFPSRLSEAKGLPPGWVSVWKLGGTEKKHQKQSDGSWIEVPDDTPLGLQPYYSAGQVGGKKFSADDEMMSYLDSIGFNDPKIQATLLKNPKFVGDALKKFGAGWFQKFKSLAGTKGEPAAGAGSGSPAASPSAPPSDPVEHALQKLGFSADSPEGFVVAQLFKYGGSSGAVDAYGKKYGVPPAKAFYAVEDVWKKAHSLGVIDVDPEDEFDVKVTFKTGGAPVVSAPVVAVAPSVSTSLLTNADQQEIDDVVSKLGLKPGSDAALAVTFIKKNKGDLKAAAADLLAAAALSPAVAATVVAQIHGQMVNSGLAKPSKKKKASAPAPAPEPASAPASASTPVSAPPTLSGGLSGAEYTSLQAKLNYPQNSIGQKAILLLWTHKGDTETAASVLNAWFPNISSDVATKLVKTAKTLADNTLAGLKGSDVTKGLDDLSISQLFLPTHTVKLTGGVSPPTEPPAGSAEHLFSTKPGIEAAIDKALAAAGLHLGDKVKKDILAVLWSGSEDALAAEADVTQKFEDGAAVISALKTAGIYKVKTFDENGELAGPPYKSEFVVPGDADPTPSSKKKAVLPAIPPMSELTDVGEAKTKLGGNKPKRFLKDNAGNLFLHKLNAERIRAAGGEVASNIAALVVGPGNFVPVKAVEQDGEWSTIQPIVADAKQLTTNISMLTKEQLAQLVREHVLDWVTSSHDSKPGNFILTPDGTILGIDKEQAFKFIGDDVLSVDYKPNPSEPIHNILGKAYAAGKIDLDLNAALPVIQAIENVSDEDWEKAVKPYLDALPVSKRKETLAAILDRKHNVRKDFEKYYTELRKKRGEPPFTFPDTGPKLKKKSPFAPGVLAAPSLPSVASLTYAGKATGIGGAGEKHFYTDDTGKKWLLKVAANKSSGVSEPFKAVAQTFFSKVGLAVKPDTVPVGPAEFAGKPATLQPWLGDKLKSLSGTAPTALTPTQMKDVADEHVLDWLMSQHDTHGGNLVVLPSGSVVGIDKEQAFKYLLPNPAWKYSTPEGDKLATDYHPNAQYGEQEPYYNKFWNDFAAGKLDFDPTVMKDAIAAVEKIPDDQYAKELAAYAEAAYPDDVEKQSQLIQKALARKVNIRAEFENFITELYKKRTKKKGKFTYAGGWVPEGAVAVAPAAVSQPIPAVVAPPHTPPPTSIPAVPTGYVAPAAHEVAKVAGKLKIPEGGVYYPALSALAQYGQPDLAIQALTASGVAPEMAAKRVKYCHKKVQAAGGWPKLLAPEPAPGSAAAAVAPTGESKVVLFQHPKMSGMVGVKNPKMVEAEDVKLTETKVTTPPGYPPAAPGKMWEVKPFSQFFGSVDSGGYLYKVKAPKDKNGNKLDASPYVLLKLSKLNEQDAAEAFKAIGVSPVVASTSAEEISNDKPFFESGTHLCCIVKKADWEAAQAKNPQIALQVDIPPPEIQTSSTGKYTTTPAAGELTGVVANGNLEELKTLHTSKEIGYARGYIGDGKAVEHLSLTVQRNEDEQGTFYRVNFKLREQYWKALTGGKTTTFTFNRTKYDPSKDAWVKTKDGGEPTDTFDAKSWESEGSKLYVGTGYPFAFKGFVSADVRLKAGETLEEGLRRTLAAADPKLADTVLTPAKKEDVELVGLAALFWSIAPQQADVLPDSERTVPKYREKLKALGYSDEELDSIRMETVALGYSTPVLPGRWKKLAAKFDISHIGIAGRGNVDAIVDQICGGTIGVVQRLLQGVPVYHNTTSAEKDLQTGGGDYVYGNVVGKQGAHTPGWGGGEVVMVFDPSELDRLDAFIHQKDYYGCVDPNGPFGFAWKSRLPIEKGLKTHAEILFRRGVNSRKLLKVRVADKTVAENIIARLKAQGITHINGMKPEELVVVKGSNTTFHDTYLKPAGY